MAAKADPNDTDLFNDSPKLRGENQVKAENFHKQRQERLRIMSEQSNFLTTSRMDGMEWKRRPRTTFTEEELDKIIPTRRLSYIIKKAAFITVVSIAVAIPTLGTGFFIAAVCAEIKLGGSFEQAADMLQASPSDYFHRVYDALASGNP